MDAGFTKGGQVKWAAKPVQKHNVALRETTTCATEREYAPNEMPRRAPPLERKTEQRRKSGRAKNFATPFGLEKSRSPRVVNAAAARSGYMDTITTIQSLLQSNGSARPVTVSLTPNERRLIAAAPDLYEALKRAEFRVRFVMDVGEPHEYSEWVELHDQIEAALLKAEGK